MQTDDPTRPMVDLPPDAFRALGHEAIDLITQFFADINEVAPFPARSPAEVHALFDRPLPMAAEDARSILADWTTKILPNSSVLGSPRWFGFVNGSGNQIGTIADALASALNPNVGGWKASPAATEIERRTIAWLSEMISYAPDAGGLFLSGGTMANMAALRAALHDKATWDINRDGLQTGNRRMTVYMADHETHVSFQAAVDFLGLGQASLRRVPSNPDFTIDIRGTRIDARR